MNYENGIHGNQEVEAVDPIEQLVILLSKKPINTFSSEVGGITLEPYQAVLNSLPVDPVENEFARTALAKNLAQVLSEERLFKKRKKWWSRAILLYNGLNLAIEIKKPEDLYEQLERLRTIGKVTGEYKGVRLIDLLEKALDVNRPPQPLQEPKKGFFSQFNDIIMG